MDGVTSPKGRQAARLRRRKRRLLAYVRLPPEGLPGFPGRESPSLRQGVLLLRGGERPPGLVADFQASGPQAGGADSGRVGGGGTPTSGERPEVQGSGGRCLRDQRPTAGPGAEATASLTPAQGLPPRGFSR